MPEQPSPVADSTITLAQGNLVVVESEVLAGVIALLVKKSLLEKFSKFLSDNSHENIIIDVSTANLLKKFLLANRQTDEASRNIIMCACGGGWKGP